MADVAVLVNPESEFLRFSDRELLFGFLLNQA